MKSNLLKVIFVFENDIMVQVNTAPEAIALATFSLHFEKEVAIELANLAFKIWIQVENTPSIERIADIISVGIESSQIGLNNYEAVCKYVKKNY